MVEVGCANCDGTGFLVREEAGREVVTPCPCTRRERGATDLVAAGVPRRYLRCTLDSFIAPNAIQRQALAVARDFVANWPAVGGGILFHGNCGTGKTHLATAILRQLVLDFGIDACFADYQDLLKRIQATYGRSGGEGATEDDVLSPVLTADLLVLDDLGSRRSTAWAEETVAHVLTVRYNEERPTILTTNLLLVDDLAAHAPHDEHAEHLPGDAVMLSERINERTRSRIEEMCRAVHMVQEDHRRKGR